MKIKIVQFAIAIVSAVFLTSANAHAAPLPSAQFSADVADFEAPNDVSSIRAPGSVSNSECRGNIVGCFSNTAATSGNLIASVNSTTTASPFAPGSIGVPTNATISYFFRVNGPQDVLVPLDVVGHFTTSLDDAVGPGFAAATAGIRNDFGGTFINPPGPFGDIIEACTQPGGCEGAGPQDLSLNVGYSTRSNGLAEFTLFASCSITSARTSASCSAVADPIISIDPLFLADHSGFSLELSPGIANGAGGVPEPTAWATMLIGFGVLGAAMRRRIAIA